MTTPPDIPSSILIVGSGVFGLSTAFALTQRPEYAYTKITLLDRTAFPAPDAASIDSSRIIRADYADASYAALAREAQILWRGEWGSAERYSEAGLCLVLGDDETAKGRESVEGSLKNLREKFGLREGRREEGGEVQVSKNREEVKEVFAGSMAGDGVGRWGYVNWTSGWADAEAGMRFLREKVEGSGRVKFRIAEIRRLVFTDAEEKNGRRRVKGVETVGGEQVTADLTVLATGAWTPKFLDLRGIASATGQILAYTTLAPEEQERLGGNPTMLDEGNGCFIIPPREGILKVARHGFGYANPTRIPHPEPMADNAREEDTITVSLPWTKADDRNLQVPPEGQQACRAFLRNCIPELAERPWTNTRICWYLDTRNGDWLVDYHAKYEGLFVATAGSGHAYKFLPVIGERIVDVMQRRDRDELGSTLREKWRWPKQRHADDHVWTEDWRGGRRGMILNGEMSRVEG